MKLHHAIGRTLEERKRMKKAKKKSNRAMARDLRAFNRWFQKSDLPGSALLGAYEAWLEAGYRGYIEGKYDKG